MKRLEPGQVLDGFVVQACIHAGSMAHIYSVTAENTPTGPGEGVFPLVMKVPRMTAGDGAENLIGFEVEQQILPALSGPHVPRFVASSDLAAVPYLVMERIPGPSLLPLLHELPLPIPKLVSLGIRIARALERMGTFLADRRA